MRPNARKAGLSVLNGLLRVAGMRTSHKDLLKLVGKILAFYAAVHDENLAPSTEYCEEKAKLLPKISELQQSLTNFV